MESIRELQTYLIGPQDPQKNNMVADISLSSPILGKYHEKNTGLFKVLFFLVTRSLLYFNVYAL